MSVCWLRVFRDVRWIPAGLLACCWLGAATLRADQRKPDPTVPLRAALAQLTADYPTAADRWHALARRLEALAARPSDVPTAELEALRRQLLLSHPALANHPLLYVVRQQYTPDHHNTATFFPAAKHEYNNGHFTPGGALKLIDLSHGNRVRTLLDLPEGVVRDPDVSFDGQRILFSMRRNAADSYHLYEINADGTGLRQLTFARDVDDLDPIYLPDGDIVFTSTREPKYCMCNRHIMANLHRMNGDGANIHQIGKSTLFEGHPTLMPDGRVLYDRWEYVDRNFGDAQALWTVNPDGTAHAVYWGNNTAAPGAVIDGRGLPGGDRVLCVFSSCHDRPWGALALVDRRLGLDGAAPVIRIWPPDARAYIQQAGWEKFDAFKRVPLKYEDPFPLDEHFFLCARQTGQGEEMGLFLVDTFGNERLLHREAPGCFDPMPLAPRARPPALPARTDLAAAEGRFLVQDVYQGLEMTGVKRGSVKWLRVVESPEKRFWTRPAWGGQGQEGPAMNWHDFNNKRILGTVPVEPDGSALFTVPAGKFVYFQLLDERGLMVQSMRSGAQAQPGETTACVGCHEDRRTAPPAPAGSLRALQRPPSRLTGWHGPPREFNFLTEVQPVFDRHCVGCHDFGQEAGRVLNLARDRNLVFNTAYNELWRKKMVHVPGAGPATTQPAKSWGSHASPLIRTLLRPHYGVTLSAEELERVATWVDLNAPYYPSYASAYPDNLAGRSPLDNQQLGRLEELTGVPLRKLAHHRNNRGPQISFDRPELSPGLQPLRENREQPTAYREALAIIRTGAAQLAARPNPDTPGFVPTSIDQWRDHKYTARETAEVAAREALRQGRRRYDPSSDAMAP